MEVVVREASRVFDLGVEFRGNHHVAIEDRFRLLDDYAAVFAAAGAGESRVLGAPGAESSGVVTALSFLKEVKRGGRTTAGRRVVVVGGGNVAVDAAMTAKRLGADRVDLVCLESRQDMPAHEWEIEDAAAEGVALHPGLGVRRVARTDSGAVVELARCLQVYDPDGLFCPVYGGEPAGSMEADLVVAAVGQTSVEPADDRDERILVGGDAASGPGSVAAALADGKRAAAAIHNRTAPGPRSLDPRQTRLGDLDAFSMRDLLIERPNYDHHRVVGLEEIEPIFVESRPPAGVDRRRPGGWSGFDEVRRTPSRAEALAEAERCLFCGTCTECGWCELFCPDLALRPGRPSETPARVDADHCKGCSVCVAVCRGRVLIMEDLG
jgi:Pyruvate/2-oxoacid:ferredoxin oxidoreductase delta subunit